MNEKRKENNYEKLARMVQRGFDGVDKQLSKTVTVEYVDKKFGQVDKRFDKIEKIILDDYGARIEKLEMKVEYLENILNLPSKK